MLKSYKKQPWVNIVVQIAFALFLPDFAFGDARSEPSSIAKAEPIVITISYMPIPSHLTSTSVNQIDAQTIGNRPTATITDLLQQVPGIHAEQTAGRGGVGSIYLRGSDPNYTLVLIDGIPANDPTNSRGGSFDFSTLDVADIQRIEVAAGPLTAIYGSGAIAGVINIISKQGKGPARARIQISGGTDKYKAGNVSVSGNDESMDYHFTVSSNDSGTPIKGSNSLSQLFSGQLGYEFNESTILRGFLRVTDTEHTAFPDDSGGPMFSVLRDTDSREVLQKLIGIKLEHFGDSGWGQQLKYNNNFNEENFESPGVVPGVRDSFGIPPSSTLSEYQRHEIDWRVDRKVTDYLRLTFGANVNQEDGSMTGEIDFGSYEAPSNFQLQRTNYALYAESMASLDERLSVQTSLRIEEPDGYEEQVIPRIGAIYTLDNNKTKIRANWGLGYKLPSLYALGHPIVGNPALKTEKSNGMDVTISSHFLDERLSMSLGFYHNRFKNLIDLQESPSLLLINRSEVVTQGIQFNAKYIVNRRIHLTGNIDYLETDIRNSSEKLRNRPTWRAHAGLTWYPKQKVGIGLDATYVGSRNDSSIPTGDINLSDYTRFDLVTNWKIDDKNDMFFAINNLFDVKYQDAVGFPGEGLSFQMGMTIVF